MTEIARKPNRSRDVVQWLFAVAFVGAVAATGRFSGLMNKAGLLYLAAGSVAAALMSFTGSEIATAFRLAAGRPGTEVSRLQSAYFWEAAARNAWMLGALGSALNFTVTLSSESAGISTVANGMIGSLLVVLYGLILAVLCLIPAMKLADQSGPARPSPGKMGAGATTGRTARTMISGRVLGYILFAAVMGLTVVFMMGGEPQNGPLPIGKVLFHGPAILIVIGGAIALALFMGSAAGGRALTLGFAMTGLIALLTGLIQALFGFANRNLADVASAVAFLITSSSFSLLGLVAVAAPLEDREIMEGRREKPGPFSRLLWAVFPLVTFIGLILTFIMVVTPMQKSGAPLN